MSGSTLRGTGSVQSNGDFDWQSGTIEVGSFVNEGQLDITGTVTHDLRTLINRGTVTQQGPIRNRGTGALIDNQQQGIYVIDSPTQIKGFQSSSTFRNAGTLRPTANGVSEIEWGILNDGGTVEVLAGTLSTSNAAYVQTAGQTLLNGGNLSASRRGVDLQGGQLSGSGLITGNLTNAAEIMVGGVGMAGSLEVTGDYTQLNTGILRMELGGTDSTRFDRLILNSNSSTNTSLDGTLDLTLIDGYLPSGGELFDILFFRVLTGSFATIAGQTLPNGIELSEQYASNRFSLSAT